MDKLLGKKEVFVLKLELDSKRKAVVSSSGEAKVTDGDELAGISPVG